MSRVQVRLTYNLKVIEDQQILKEVALYSFKYFNEFFGGNFVTKI